MNQAIERKCTKDHCKICELESFIDPDWKEMLLNEIENSNFKRIKNRLHEYDIFYPPVELIFNFTLHSSFPDIKVVIIGQDPYHNPGQAMGLSFSVPTTVKVPPSLANIYLELQSDIPGFKIPKHGNLTSWAKQGVLLLNSTLTVSKNEPNSHSNIGWNEFTSKILQLVSDRLENVVFILWGNHAKKHAKFIDPKKHLILEAAHPSPFSVKAFRGCKHFSKANAYLIENGKEPVDWKL